MKKHFMIILLIVVCLFINISGVNARVDAGGGTGSNACTYGVVCTYQFCGNGTAGCPSNNFTVVADVAFRCNGSDKRSSSCTAFTYDVSANKNNGASHVTVNFNIDNNQLKQDNVYNIKYHFEENGYTCPSLVISGSGNNYSASFHRNGESVPTSAQNISGTRKMCIAKDQNVKLDTGSDADKIAEDSWEQQVNDTENATTDDAGAAGGDILDKIEQWGNSGNETKYDKTADDPCNIISGDMRDLLHDVFFYISIAGVIILVVMTSISLVKVVTASEDNALSGFLKGLWKRIICLIILLLLPAIITFAIQVVNGAGKIWGVNSNDPLCNIVD